MRASADPSPPDHASGEPGRRHHPIPLRCRDSVGTGFLVVDDTRVWLLTCVHLLSGAVRTLVNAPCLDATDLALTVMADGARIPLFDRGGRRFSFTYDPSDGEVFDVIAVRLSVGEADGLACYRRHQRGEIGPATPGRRAIASGYPGLAGGLCAPSTLDAIVERVHGASILLSRASVGGLSGGPLVSDGMLVGIVHGDIGTPERMTNGLAIALDVVADALLR